jgi:hypothetical protein
VGGTQKEQGSATEHSALLRHNARVLVALFIALLRHMQAVPKIGQAWERPPAGFGSVIEFPVSSGRELMIGCESEPLSLKSEYALLCKH